MASCSHYWKESVGVHGLEKRMYIILQVNWLLMRMIFRCVGWVPLCFISGLVWAAVGCLKSVTILVLLLGRERCRQIVVQIPTTKKITWQACKRIYFLPSLCYHRWIINLVKCRIFSMWPVSTCNPKILAHISELFKLTKSSPDLLIPAESLLFSFTGRMFFFYGFIVSVFQVCLISMCWKR